MDSEITKHTEQALNQGISQLNGMYARIGYTEEEKQDKMSQLESQLLAIISSTVQTEEETLCSLQEQLESGMERVKELSRCLQETREVTLSEALKTASLRKLVDTVQWEIAKFERSISRNREQLEELHGKLHSMWDALDLSSSPELVNINFSEFQELGSYVGTSLIAKFKFALDEVLPLYESRSEQVRGLTERIRAFFDLLDIAPRRGSGDEQLLCASGREDLSLARVRRLQERLAGLEELKEQRTLELAELQRQLDAVWERLRVSRDEKERFLDAQQGLRPRVFQAYKDEIAARHAEFRARLRELITQTRQGIDELCEQLGVDASEQQPSPGACDETELEACEARATALDQRWAVCRPIVEAVQRVAAYEAEKAEVEKRTKDKERVMSRNAKINREMREDNKRLGTIDRDIRGQRARLAKLLQQWSEEQREPFLYQGADLVAEFAASGVRSSSSSSSQHSHPQAPSTVARASNHAKTRRPGDTPARAAAAHAPASSRRPHNNNNNNINNNINNTNARAHAGAATRKIEASAAKRPHAARSGTASSSVAQTPSRDRLAQPKSYAQPSTGLRKKPDSKSKKQKEVENHPKINL